MDATGQPVAAWIKAVRADGGEVNPRLRPNGPASFAVVFYNPETGKPFVDLDAGFAVARKKAGIDGVTWHTLWHTFASCLVNRGVDIVTVQQLPRAFYNHCNHALHAYKSRFQTRGGREAGNSW